ncbi:MAG: hypothetical protein LW863_14900 [Flammeovirgaceae bacterium]|jgi:hypothetical protein|nr:hypothetical protein [Flammeovirgaceae bacterium]
MAGKKLIISQEAGPKNEDGMVSLSSVSSISLQDLSAPEKLQDLADYVSALSVENAVLKGERAGALSALSEANQQAMLLEMRLDRLQSASDRVSRNFAQARAELKAAWAEVDAKSASAIQEAAAYEEKIAELSRNVDVRLQELEQEKTSLLESVQNHASSIEVTFNANAEQISELTASNEQLTSQRDAAFSKIEEFRQEIDAITAALNAKAAELNALQAFNEQLQAEKSAALANAEALTQSVAGLSADLNLKNEETEALTERVQQLEHSGNLELARESARVQQLEGELVIASRRLETLEGNAESKEGELNALAVTTAKQSKALSLSEAKAKQLLQKVRSLETELAAKSKEGEKLLLSVQELKDKNAAAAKKAAQWQNLETLNTALKADLEKEISRAKLISESNAVLEDTVQALEMALTEEATRTNELAAAIAALS